MKVLTDDRGSLMDKDERISYIVVGIVALAVITFGGSLLVSAVSLGAQLITSSTLIIFQILIAILASVVAMLLVVGVVKSLLNVTSRIAKQHPAVAQAAKTHGPAIAAVFVLAASVLPSAGSPFFGDNALLATGISIIMTVLFFTAANFMTDTRTKWRRFGYFLWYATALLLPITVGFYHRWDIAQMSRTAGIDTAGDIALLVGMSLAIIILPRWSPRTV
jgi:uncharacterized membrane protein